MSSFDNLKCLAKKTSSFCEDLREAKQSLKDQQKDSEVRVKSLLAEHKLTFATARDATQAEITKYRDELTEKTIPSSLRNLWTVVEKSGGLRKWLNSA